MSDHATQRADIQSKYDFIYGVLADITRAVVAAPDGDPQAKYRKLRELVPSIWATLPGLVQDSRKRGLASIEFPDLMAAAAEHCAAICSWTESGAPHQAPRRVYQDAFGAAVSGALLRHIPNDRDLILDLGCGWGHRMFDLWLRKGAGPARYVGVDRSPHSGEMVKDVARLFPDMPVTWFPFDFLQPDFAPVGTDYKNIAVFTVHAIEQVQRLGPALFDRLITQFPGARLTGVHIEPVGFQFEGEGQLDPDAAAVDRAYAEKRQYNLDLVQQVLTHTKLSVVAKETGLISTGKGNSTSVLVWASK